MDYVVVIIISYLMGSIPFGLILTKIFLKKDIRNIGSGNIGATNVLRSGNKLIGYLTLFLDILKAVIPIFYIKFNYLDLIYISSLSVFLGHVFPVWLRFKGGKGVATYVGILLCLNLIYVFVFFISWILVFFLSKYSSLSSLVASLSVPIYLFFTNGEQVIFYVIIFVLIFYTHRENIKRLKNNEESKSNIY